jgi:branched-chain amino acid transport system ATP-binding protein
VNARGGKLKAGQRRCDLACASKPARTQECGAHVPDRAHAAGTDTYIDQKRVEFARALASDPKVLQLDEWLAGLNSTELRRLSIDRSARVEGRTIIVVEHVMDATARYATAA